MKNLKNFIKFNESNEEIDNFTARYYDNYDDEEEAANEDDLQEFSSQNKKIQMFEDFIQNYTYEMSGSPSPTFKTKADFVEFMSKHGFKHTTLNKSTNMLIVADKEQGTLKCKKAEKYGIPIYTYDKAKKKVQQMSKEVSKYNL